LFGLHGGSPIWLRPLGSFMKSSLFKTRTPYIILGLFFFSTLIIYWKTLGYGFYYDDYRIKIPYDYSLSDLSHGVKRNRPLMFVLWLTISLIGGQNPAPFHAVAIAMHLLCGLSFYLVMKIIIKNSRIDLGGFHAIALPIATGIFLLHPLQTESVIYSFQAMSVLPMALSSFIAIGCFVKYRTCGKKPYLFGVFLLAFLASTSRESAIVLPVCLWLVDLIFFCEGRVKESLRRWPIFIGCLAVSAATIAIGASFVSYSKAGMGFGYKNIAPFSYLITQFVVIIKYLRLIFIPLGQNLDYDFPIYTSLFSFKPAFSFLALLGIFTSGVCNLKKNPMFAFGILCFFLFLAPTSTVVPIEDVIFEHRLYLPLAGLSISFLPSINFLINKPLIFNIKSSFFLITALIIVLSILGLLTFFRLEVWKDNVALWSDVIKKSPNKARPYNNLGIVLEEKKQYNAAISYYTKALRLWPNFPEALSNLGNAVKREGQLDTAIGYYTKALQIKPDYAIAHYNIGLALTSKGKLNEALRHYEKALRMKHRWPELHNNIGMVLGDLKKFDEAIIHFSRALRFKSEFPDAHNNMGNVLIEKGEIGKAIFHYKEALRIDPNYEKAHNNLGNILDDQGKFEKAVSHFLKAIGINPTFAEAHSNLGIALANQGNLKEAVVHYSLALQIKPDYAEVHNNLGAALARQEKWKEAIVHFYEALRIKPDLKSAQNNLESTLKTQGSNEN